MDTVGGDHCTTDGMVSDVVYLGAETRFVVAIDGATTLVVTEQNLTDSLTALAHRGRQVRLAWDKRHTLRLAGDETGTDTRRAAS